MVINDDQSTRINSVQSDVKILMPIVFLILIFVNNLKSVFIE